MDTDYELVQEVDSRGKNSPAARAGNRIRDFPIVSRLLHQLSYSDLRNGKKFILKGRSGFHLKLTEF